MKNILELSSNLKCLHTFLLAIVHVLGRTTLSSKSSIRSKSNDLSSNGNGNGNGNTASSVSDELKAFVKASGGSIAQLKRLRSDGTWEDMLADGSNAKRKSSSAEPTIEVDTSTDAYVVIV